jgi:hypothetical protein
VPLAREIAEYKLKSVRVHEVRWDRGSTEPVGDYTFFYGTEIQNHKLDIRFLHIWKLYQQLRTEHFSKRMSYIFIRNYWRNIGVLDVHATTEDKTDDTKESFYEELGSVFNQLLKYHEKTLLGDFNI